jgi:para-nitrobenzyl esterase
MFTPSSLGRRQLIKTAATIAGGSALSALLPDFSKAQEPSETFSPPPTTLIASANNAVVQTTAGKVRGFTRNGIQTFKGIPYGAAPTGVARFLPPSPRMPWSGVRSTMQYGYVCPQVPRDAWQYDEIAFLYDWDDGQSGEDCLLLNIWTPAVNDGGKRPVMVWLHGGGYVAGSGQELKSYEGENLSRRGDVVVLSLNHRLGVLGFLDLSQIGDSRFARSGNAGMLDIVLALQWVRDNIANFGGDPGNVTVFGQSGGGGKVSTLMAMPTAQGLFHRAVVQSGSILKQAPRARAAKLTAAVLEELGLAPLDLDQLQTMPVERIVAAGTAASKRLEPPPTSGRRPPAPNWQPLVDGDVLPTDPFDPAAPAISAQIPMLIGTVMNENSPSMSDASLESMDNAELTRRAQKLFGQDADKVLQVARGAHPQAKPVEILSLISAPRPNNSVIQARRKAALNAAPAYLYLFAWDTPVLDGRPRAFHCSELSFVFDNTDRCASMTGGGPEPRQLAAKVSDAWINFARGGNPNHAGLPAWPPFTDENGATMVFDRQCDLAGYPDRELKELLATLT